MTNMEDKAAEQEIKTIELEAPEIETEVSEDKVKEEPPSLEEQLAAAEDLAAEYLDGWQRARAEMANFKRRSEAQWAERTLFANVDLLTKLLPVLDDLQLALEKSPENTDAAWEEWRQGIALVAHKFLSFVENHGTRQCTGCGRCITACPVGIDIVAVVNRISEVVSEA